MIQPWRLSTWLLQVGVEGLLPRQMMLAVLALVVIALLFPVNLLAAGHLLNLL